MAVNPIACICGGIDFKIVDDSSKDIHNQREYEIMFECNKCGRHWSVGGKNW